MPIRTMLWLLLIAFTPSLAASGAEETLNVKWSQLPIALSGQTARIVVQGATIEAQLIAAAPESLEIVIQNSSDPKRYGKGQMTLPRIEVESIYAMRRGIRRRVAGTLLGFIGTGYAVAAAARNKNQESGWLALMPVGAVVGCYAGKHFDVSRIRIRILAE